ncbi:Methyltransferase type 11 [Solidesulfovibrio fructosivorans JJ]]|uniref:Methyltransferase type 11 n=1 Tax=Solidesulfovibrio fructosivorans JJ] TaxID=596151 RepID=E1JXU3_SOLFR|nr:class I SAM-dependent methyltransferase [Solidesulfovibrio fructosivorans]EFL50866.1 Methyltransferase type 11 [Solidesulfovibrio fructosivorans JJ]]
MDAQDICLVCGQGALEKIDSVNLGCISSDLRILDVPSSALYCHTCGHLQKNIDETFRENVLGIYSNGYVLPGGQIDVCNGTVMSRGAAVATSIRNSLHLPEHGTMLDFGCGHGFFLRDFHGVFQKWALYGYDITTDKVDELSAIAGVNGIFTDGIDAVDQRFDLITLNHVLEHLIEPVAVLRALRGLLRPGGRIIVRVPSYLELYSEFVIGDHVSLYTTRTLETAVALAGLVPDAPLQAVSGRELAMVLAAGNPKTDIVPDTANLARGKAILAWLKTQRDLVVGELAGHPPFGLYGVSGMGGWLGSLAPDKVDFFVDDNPAMNGMRLYGIEIVSPDRIPQGATIFVAFKREIAAAIHDRVQASTPTVRYVYPETLTLPG